MLLRRYWKAIGIAVVLCLSLSLYGGETVRAVQTLWSERSDVKVKEIDGELYIRADDVTRLLEAERGRQIQKVIEKVSPSVVAIIGKPADEGAAGDRYALTHGTGVIMDAEGWIMTNAHVVENMTRTTVITADGKQYAAKKTHYDEDSDLALLKIEATGLKAATFADTPAVVGETAVAIGTPISSSLRNSATAGIVSGVDRSISATYRLLQTDAAINPGNSGGPLVNAEGKIIGINTMKYSAVGIDNLSFAIPADTARYVYRHFRKYGEVKRPYTGMQLEESWAAIAGLPSDDPAKVLYVEGGSPADEAGIRKDDLLYSIDEKPVHTIVDFNEILKDYMPGDQAVFMLQSGGDLVKKTVVFGEIPEN